MVYSYMFSVATIAPALGCVLTVGRSLIPLKEVLTVRKERRLGVLIVVSRCMVTDMRGYRHAA